MGLRRLAQALTLTMLTAAALAAPAAAQDAPKSAPSVKAPRAPDAAPRLDLALACETRDGLSLCVKPRAGRKTPPARLSEEDSAGRFRRFTRLAGMFMGRVDAASVGPFRLRLTLDLR